MAKGFIETYSNVEIEGDVEYRQFQTKFRNYLKTILPEGWELAEFHKNWFCCSAFFRNGDKYIYLSLSDVRGCNMSRLFDSILVRTARDCKDFTGGGNNYVHIDELPGFLKKMENYDW